VGVVAERIAKASANYGEPFHVDRERPEAQLAAIRKLVPHTDNPADEGRTQPDGTVLIHLPLEGKTAEVAESGEVTFR
jgi:hypothetical protein